MSPAPDPALDPSTRLLLACARTPRDATTQARVRDCAADIGDWQAFMHALSRHRMAPLAYATLSEAGVRIPPHIHKTLHQTSLRTLTIGLQQVRETAWATSLLTEAGIRCASFKGVSLEYLAFGEPGRKFSKDIDLYVPPAQAHTAITTLEQAGCRIAHDIQHGTHNGSDAAGTTTRRMRAALLRNKKDIALRTPAGIEIELHWALFTSPERAGHFQHNLSFQNVPVNKTKVLPTFATPDLFAYLCLHGMYHGWRRLKWLAEVNALWLRQPPDMQAAILEACRSRHAELAAAQAFGLMQALLDTPLPPAMPAMRARSGAALPALRAHALSEITGTDTDSVQARIRRTLRNEWIFLRHVNSLRDTVSRFSALSVSSVDIMAMPLPRGMDWVYPLIRLPSVLMRYAWPRRTPQSKP